ncbi:hypothetical protein ABL57_07945 [Kocuria sp. SM24M-10]|nr:hypothetical protein ABL57_07945 [Kocuria sp. SM24M-10]
MSLMVAALGWLVTPGKLPVHEADCDSAPNPCALDLPRNGIDIKAMLDRVVAEVFDETFAVRTVGSSDAAWLPGVQVSRRADNGRAAIIRASYEWMVAFISELEVQVALFDYDDVEVEKEAELRRLCLVMRAYLHGEGYIEQRRRLFRRGRYRC